MDFYDIAKEYEINDPCIADAIGSLLAGDIAKAEHALKRYRELNGTACDGAPVDAQKPDWKDAPEWADYLAMDKFSRWFWFEGEIFIKMGNWIYHGRHQLAGGPFYTYPIHWKDTLDRRPK